MANNPITPTKVNFATGDVLTAQQMDDLASAVNRGAAFATQATANSTKTLVLTDSRTQEFTGTTAGQIVVMPVTSTLGVGMPWLISNKSTQTIAVQSSGANAIVTVSAATDVLLTCNAITGTTASSWSYSFVGSTTAAAGGGMTLINAGGTTLTGASVTVGSIPATYKALKIVVEDFLPATDGWQLVMQFNADATASRHVTSVNNTSDTNLSFGATFINLSNDAGADNAVTQSLITAEIPDYANTGTWKFAKVESISNNSTTPTNVGRYSVMGIYNQTTAISSLLFKSASGNLTSGTVYVYGVN